MPYASTTHVEALNQGRPPLASARPGEATAGQVTAWLDQTAAILDGLLAQQGYAVPVSPTAASSALKTLENFNAAGAHYHREASAKTRDKTQYEEAKAMWKWAQKMISEGLVELDLAIDAAESLPRGGFDGTSTAATPYFMRDMEL